MNASEFVSRLAASAPRIEELIAEGISRGGAIHLRASYLCEQKHIAGEINELNPLLDLIARFDTSNLEIGVITLNPAALTQLYGADLKSMGKILVGAIEADPLVVNVSTGEIENLDHADLTFRMCVVAKSGAMLLDA